MGAPSSHQRWSRAEVRGREDVILDRVVFNEMAVEQRPNKASPHSSQEELF